MGLNESCGVPTKKKNEIGSSPLSPNIDFFSKFFYVLN